MTDNKYFWTLLTQSWAVSYPLAYKRSSMWMSVVAVSAILLALSVSLVSFSTVKQWPGTVLPPCGKTWLLQNNFSAHVRPERAKYARLQKSGGARKVRTYCSDDAIHITRTVRCPSRTRKKWSILWPLVSTNERTSWIGCFRWGRQFWGASGQFLKPFQRHVLKYDAYITYCMHAHSFKAALIAFLVTSCLNWWHN